jgi:hypothetical protein
MKAVRSPAVFMEGGFSRRGGFEGLEGEPGAIVGGEIGSEMIVAMPSGNRDRMTNTCG